MEDGKLNTDSKIILSQRIFGYGIKEQSSLIILSPVLFYMDVSSRDAISTKGHKAYDVTNPKVAYNI